MQPVSPDASETAAQLAALEEAAFASMFDAEVLWTMQDFESELLRVQYNGGD